MPPITGITTSLITTSGPKEWTSWSAVCPSPAVFTLYPSGSSRSHSNAQTWRLSSATRTRHFSVGALIMYEHEAGSGKTRGKLKFLEGGQAKDAIGGGIGAQSQARV